ncbi:MAG: hypothetical protein EA402_10360 [Planctomycetota bacterium]|nr:MAG: hypothetical protein EA402_10360 [Planctomycetota bacterium]
MLALPHAAAAEEGTWRWHAWNVQIPDVAQGQQQLGSLSTLIHSHGAGLAALIPAAERRRLASLLDIVGLDGDHLHQELVSLDLRREGGDWQLQAQLPMAAAAASWARIRQRMQQWQQDDPAQGARWLADGWWFERRGQGLIRAWSGSGEAAFAGAEGWPQASQGLQIAASGRGPGGQRLSLQGNLHRRQGGDPRETSGLWAEGQLRGLGAGLRPLDLRHMPALPQNQALALLLGLEAEGVLRAELFAALDWLLQDALDPALAQALRDVQGSFFLSLSIQPQGWGVSLGLDHQASAEAVATILGFALASQQTALAYPVASRTGLSRPWYMRRQGDWWWWSQDQVVLAHLSGYSLPSAADWSGYRLADNTVLALAMNHRLSYLGAQHLLGEIRNLVDDESPGHMPSFQPLSVSASPALAAVEAVAKEQPWSLLQLRHGQHQSMDWQWFEPLPGLLQFAWFSALRQELAQQRIRQGRQQQLRQAHRLWTHGDEPILPLGAIALWPGQPRQPQAVWAVDDPEVHQQAGTLVVFMDGSVLWFDQPGLAHRARRIQRILATGHSPRNLWGSFGPLLEAAFNRYHTGDPHISPLDPRDRQRR